MTTLDRLDWWSTHLNKKSVFHQVGVFGSRVKVRELRDKLTNLVGEKRDIVLLKTQVEEQYRITATQLKAKVNPPPLFILLHSGLNSQNLIHCASLAPAHVRDLADGGPRRAQL